MYLRTKYRQFGVAWGETSSTHEMMTRGRSRRLEKGNLLGSSILQKMQKKEKKETEIQATQELPV